MWGLPLLLASLLVVTATADKAEAQQWVEVIRRAANRLMTENNFDDAELSAVEKKISKQLWTTYSYVKPATDEYSNFVSNTGVEGIRGILDCMKSNFVRAITPAQATGDDLAAWYLTTDKGIRKTSIRGKFDANGNLGELIFIDDRNFLF